MLAPLSAYNDYTWWLITESTNGPNGDLMYLSFFSKIYGPPYTILMIFFWFKGKYFAEDTLLPKNLQ